QKRPLAGQAGRFPHGEGAPHIASPFLAGQFRLGPGCADPYELLERQGEAEPVSNPIRQRQRLVELTVSQAAGMERDGHDQGDGWQLVCPDEHQVGQWCRECIPAPVLEQVDRLLQYSLVAVGGEGAVERGRFLPARATEICRSGDQREWRIERAPAPGADRALDGPDRLPTVPAEEGQPALRGRPTAGGAGG